MNTHEHQDGQPCICDAGFPFPDPEEQEPEPEPEPETCPECLTSHILNTNGLCPLCEQDLRQQIDADNINQIIKEDHYAN